MEIEKSRLTCYRRKVTEASAARERQLRVGQLRERGSRAQGRGPQARTVIELKRGHGEGRGGGEGGGRREEGGGRREEGGGRREEGGGRREEGR